MTLTILRTNIKEILAALLLMLTFMVAVPAGVSASSHDTNPIPNTNKAAVCEGVGLVDGQTDCNTGDPQGAIGRVVKAAIDLISIVVGVIAVIMIIIGGLKYIMSSGDSNNINSAKNTILYAIIGLVIVALAQIIVRYVLTNVG